MNRTLRALSDAFETCLRSYVDEAGVPAVLYESVNYSLFAGGKRIRPILLIKACELAGGTRAFAEPLAAGIEMIHTYSLIHDDLPCMDDDDYRRGKLSNHKKFGYPIAVLAGDGLLNLAFETIIGGYSGVENKDAYMQAAALIANASGIKGMVAGQAADMTGEGKAPNEEDVRFIHLHKTSALIEAAVGAGILAGNLSSEKIDAMRRYGRCIGLMFQIKDDVLDVTGSKEQMGKEARKDQGKMTYPAVYGLEASEKMVAQLRDQSIDALSVFGLKAQFFTDFAHFLYERNN